LFVQKANELAPFYVFNALEVLSSLELFVQKLAEREISNAPIMEKRGTKQWNNTAPEMPTS
jgi:hypothetical protein